MSSGHAVHVVVYAQSCSRLVAFMDPQLEDRAYVEKLYAFANIDPPRRSKFEWTFLHLDLALYDWSTGRGFVINQGWN
jgi:hypothetical protein